MKSNFVYTSIRSGCDYIPEVPEEVDEDDPGFFALPPPPPPPPPPPKKPLISLILLDGYESLVTGSIS